VLDLKQVRNLKVIVALRTNIFQHLDFGRSGGQEEKFRSASLHLRWNSNELEHMLNMRIEAARSRLGYGSPVAARNLLPSSNKARGNALDYLFSRTLMRPRDVLTFFNECLSMAGGRERLTWDIIHSAEHSYSKNRLLALRDEWKPSFPRIDALFDIFESAPTLMTRSDVSASFEEAALLLSDPELANIQWLMDLTQPIWDHLGSKDWERIHHPLMEVLYKIGFMGFIRESNSGRRWTFSYEEEDFASRASNLKSVDYFAVHPAFWRALDIEAETIDSKSRLR
jgi:hypothetical protein